MRFCLASGCGEVVEGRTTFCDDHQPLKEAWATSKRRGPNSSRWAVLRRAVLRRDGGFCVSPACPSCWGWPCTHGVTSRCTLAASEVDHIVNLAAGGTNDMRNLQALCSPHHRIKTQEESRRGRNGRASS